MVCWGLFFVQKVLVRKEKNRKVSQGRHSKTKSILRRGDKFGRMELVPQIKVEVGFAQ